MGLSFYQDQFSGKYSNLNIACLLTKIISKHFNCARHLKTLFKEQAIFLLHLTNPSLFYCLPLSPFFSIFFPFTEFHSCSQLPLVFWPLFPQLKSHSLSLRLFTHNLLPVACEEAERWLVWLKQQTGQASHSRVELNHGVSWKNKNSSGLTDKQWEAIA